MSLLLTLENAPRGQKRRDARLDQGELVIGRSPEADWQIEDPDMFVSRAHCRISGGPNGYFVTDTSSSGLFIDDSSQPLGLGNSAELQSGMRLRLGDYVLWVDVERAAARTAAPVAANAPAPIAQLAGRAGSPSPDRSSGLTGDDFFSARAPEEPKPVRPSSLPNPFDRPEPGAYAAEEERPRSAAFDDPFSLDPVSGGEDGWPPPQAPASNPFATGRDAEPPAAAGGWLDDFEPEPAKPVARPAQDPGEGSDFAFGLDSSPPARTEPPAQAAPPPPAAAPLRDEIAPPTPVAARPPWLEPDDEEASSPPPPTPPTPRPAPSQPVPIQPAPRQPVPEAPVLRRASPPRPATPAPTPRDDRQPAEDGTLRDAFFAGLGLDASDFPASDPQAEMERLGREYRLMMEGLMQLLRKRAEEKGNARLAQTTVLGTEVNPLKFLPGVDEVLYSVMSERSPGFLRGEAAVSDAMRDLAEHHVRVWRGIQTALRKMIDRFDPAAIEKELESSSAVGQLLAGGRSAMLWKIYAKRHREIATNAESRFMGEVGADFRDAYEED